jgi:hypothetical protein
VWRAKQAESACVKYWQTTLAIWAVLSASIVLADDFKTINGKEYKNVTVSRVEADGIVLKSKSGICKVYFVELPKNVQERFHYGSATPAGKAVTQRIDEAQSATHAAAFVDADRFAQQVATKLEERESILHGKQAKTRSWESMAIQELNFHNAFLAGIAIIASVLFAIITSKDANKVLNEGLGSSRRQSQRSTIVGTQVWTVDAHRDGNRFVVRADEKLTAFVELERAIHEFAVDLIS